jgi:hypothetical protein
VVPVDHLNEGRTFRILSRLRIAKLGQVGNSRQRLWTMPPRDKAVISHGLIALPRTSVPWCQAGNPQSLIDERIPLVTRNDILCRRRVRLPGISDSVLPVADPIVASR